MSTSAIAASPLGTSRVCSAAFERGEALLEREGGRRAVQAVGVAGLAASSRARAAPRRSAKITVDALYTAGCIAAEAGRRLVGVVDQRGADSADRSFFVVTACGQIGIGDQVVALGGDDARARELADLQRLRGLLRRQQAARVPSISGASA